MKFQLLFFGLLFSSSLLYSQQSNDALKNSRFSSSSLSLDKFDYNYPDLNLKIDTKKDDFLFVYNKSTNLNDVYLVTNDSFKYYKSTFSINENLLLANRRDSFNPYGADNIKDGLIIGAIGSLVKNIFNND